MTEAITWDGLYYLVNYRTCKGPVTPGCVPTVLSGRCKISFWNRREIAGKRKKMYNFSWNLNKEKMSRCPDGELGVSAELLRSVTPLPWSFTWLLTALLLRTQDVLRIYTSLSLCVQYTNCLHKTQWQLKGFRQVSVQAHSTYFTWTQQNRLKDADPVWQ